MSDDLNQTTTCPAGASAAPNVRQYRIDVLSRIIKAATANEQQTLVLTREVKATDWWERKGFLYINRTDDVIYAYPTKNALLWESARRGARAEHRQEQISGWVINRSAWHFHMRLFERYGLVLRRGEFEKLTSDALNGRGMWEKTFGFLGKSVCALRVRKALVFVIVNDAGELLTALTPGGRARTRGKWENTKRPGPPSKRVA